MGKVLKKGIKLRVLGDFELGLGNGVLFFGFIKILIIMFKLLYFIRWLEVYVKFCVFCNWVKNCFFEYWVKCISLFVDKGFINLN